MSNEFLYLLGITEENGRYEAICHTPEQRSRVAAAIANQGRGVDSKFDKESRTWTVFSLEPAR